MSDKNYTVRALIHDESFRKMVNGVADDTEISYWNHWIEKSDKNREKAQNAIAEIVGFEFSGPKDLNIDEEWNRFQKSTRKKFKNRFPEKSSGQNYLKWFYSVAAVLLLGAMIGIVTYKFNQQNQLPTSVEAITQKHIISTASDEQKTITFSDGSEIILNSNSTMQYQLGTLESQTINVDLDGEAYFDASGSREKNAPVFEVHTPNGVLHDIGTKFLVTVMRNHSQVILQEGEVVLTQKSKNGKTENTSVGKGELLEFGKFSLAKKRIVNASFYTSWATGFMHFDHTTIQEFAGFVEKKFDVDVKIVDAKLNGIRIDGSIYFKSLPGLVRSVSKVVKIPAYQSKDKKTVYLGNKLAEMNQPK